MSIPGLGQIPVQSNASSGARTVSLRPFGEWCFDVSFSATPISLKLLSGTAEKDGTELALQHVYTFAGIRSRILTWHGCELEVTGMCDRESVAEYILPTDNATTVYLSLHQQLVARRAMAARPSASSASTASAASIARTHGPRVIVCGPSNTGKTTLARTLAGWATRTGGQPLVVSTNPRDGMLSLPGTLSAAVFATVMDVETGCGWGDTPTSGPSTVPVKLPIVFHYGRRSADEDRKGYKEIATKLASTVSGRSADDDAVRESGVIVDTPGCDDGADEADLDILNHIIEEFAVNIVVVIGSEVVFADLQRRYSGQRTSLGESIDVMHLEKPTGIPDRDEDSTRSLCEAAVKEYFFGGRKKALSPSTQTVDLDALVVYRSLDESSSGEEDDSKPFSRTELSEDLQHWTLAVMDASTKDPPDMVRKAAIMGFVYVAQVDTERRKAKILAPISGRLGNRPLVWGKWPEPHMNLLG